MSSFPPILHHQHPASAYVIGNPQHVPEHHHARTAPQPNNGWSFSGFTTAATPWHTSALATSTQRQNIRLNALLAILNRLSGGDALLGFGDRSGSASSDLHGNDMTFEQLSSSVGFDKAFVEIQRLLGNLLQTKCAFLTY
jgi:hypothetical protein